MSSDKSAELRAEVEALSARLRMLRAEVNMLRSDVSESDEIVRAIRHGIVDAFVVGEPEQESVYTLVSADHPYRMIVENMREGAVTLTRDGTILYCNQSFARIVRLPLEQVIGSSFARFVTTTDAHRFAAFLAVDAASRDEMALRAEDGASVPVYVSRSAADLVGMPGICLVVTDLTEQKRQAELLASERLARSILQQASEAIVVCDTEGYVTHASRQAETLCGRNPLWRHFDAVLPLRPCGTEATADPATADCSFAALVRGAISGREVTMTRGDGSPAVLLLSSAPIYDEAQTRLGTVVILTDISQQRQTAEALRESERRLRALNESLEARVVQRTIALSRANRALEQKNRELQDFAYVASHDLQEPLRKISAFSDLFLSDFHDQLEDRGRFYLDRIQDASRRMSWLIRDLLAYSRVQTHGSSFERVNLEETLATVRSQLALSMKRQNAALDADPLPTIEADREQMSLLLHHLISNALKFHREGEAPVVHVRAACYESEPGNEVVELTVEDEGIGFDEKYLDKIFSPFERLHGRSAYEGTGMGLAICRRIVERHGGTITAHSTPGQGATFVVTLPVQRGRESGPSDPPE